MDTISIQNKHCLILTDGDSTLTIPINTALVDLQTKHLDDKSYAYYAQTFLRYLQDNHITDLSAVTAGDVRYFAELLMVNHKSPAVLRKYAVLLDAVFDSFLELNGHPHPTLIHGDAAFAAGGCKPNKRKHYTLAGTIVRRKTPKGGAKTPLPHGKLHEMAFIPGN